MGWAVEWLIRIALIVAIIGIAVILGAVFAWIGDYIDDDDVLGE